MFVKVFCKTRSKGICLIYNVIIFLGWPTIRYFNKETGVQGGSYKQKTDDAICDELGNEEKMKAYVNEYGKTTLAEETEL